MAAIDTPRPDTPAAGDDGGEPPKKERFFTLGRTVGSVIVLLLAVMWLYLFIWGNNYHGPGWLTDRSYPKVAEKICDKTEDYITRLPAATQSKNGSQRADTIDLANNRLREMQNQLRAAVPQNAQSKYVYEWLDDWGTFIGDRQSYADHLRKNPAAKFLVTPKEGSQLSDSLDNFADVNDMIGCETPHDV